MGDKVVRLGEALRSTFLHLKLALEQNKILLYLLLGSEKYWGFMT